MKEAIPKLLLVMLGSGAALLLAEGAARLAPEGSRIAMEAAPRAAAPPHVRDLLMADPDPRIWYRLRPNLDTTFKGQPVRTNSSGFRGAELRNATWRIVGIGDSVMFGWGVADDEPYLSLIEQILRERGADVEAVNMGVPGYASLQEMALFRRHRERLQPSLVIVGFLNNDFQGPGFFPQRGFLEYHSYLFRLLRLRFRGTLLLYTKRERIRETFAAFHELAATGRKEGFDVLVFFYHGAPRKGGRRLQGPYRKLRSICREERMATVEFRDVLDRAIERGIIKSSRDIWIARGEEADYHPSPLGHRLAAEAIIAKLDAVGMVPATAEQSVSGVNR